MTTIDTFKRLRPSWRSNLSSCLAHFSECFHCVSSRRSTRVPRTTCIVLFHVIYRLLKYIVEYEICNRTLFGVALINTRFCDRIVATRVSVTVPRWSSQDAGSQGGICRILRRGQRYVVYFKVREIVLYNISILTKVSTKVNWPTIKRYLSRNLDRHS